MQPYHARFCPKFTGLPTPHFYNAAMRALSLSLIVSLSVCCSALAQGWFQWGRDARHHSSPDTTAQLLGRVETQMVLDPFIDAHKTAVGGYVPVHYAVPLIDGNDVFVVIKSGQFTQPATRETQIWNVQQLRRNGATLTNGWRYTSDWKPVPTWGIAGPRWEPVFHPLLTAQAVYAPGAGGTIDRINRTTGARIARLNPFGTSVDPTIFVAGPLSADNAGNVYYTAIQLNTSNPWTTEPGGSWLVRIGADGTITRATIASLTPNAPAASAPCTTQFSNNELPWPPSPNAVAPSAPCGSQRPGINVAPAIATDGTVYIVSRAHNNDRWGYLIAANADLSPKWASSMRNRFNDGCGVSLPPNGQPNGCRAGSTIGVDPMDNQRGSGRVLDDSTSSPTITPDGKILYGAYTRYNYSQGHLMQFNPDGSYANSYTNGWDLTPAIYEHDGTYSIFLKENRYGGGSYCGSATLCPDRSSTTPADPEAYYITRLDPSLRPIWRFQNTETDSCGRNEDGTVACIFERPRGFEWCINAIAIDNQGVVHVNAEDGNLYSINLDGTLRQRIFLRVAIGAAYTPLSIGNDGRVYTQNDGRLFVIGPGTQIRRRAATK